MVSSIGEMTMKEERNLVAVDDIFTLEDMAVALEEDLAEGRLRGIIISMIVASLSFISMAIVLI